MDEIEKVLNKSQNTFEPGKNVEFDKSYSGDQFEYQYQQEEKALQDELFAMYDQIENENEEN